MWHSLQFLHNINVQQLKGQQILQKKTPQFSSANAEMESYAAIPSIRSQDLTNNSTLLVTQHELRQRAVFP